MTNTNPLSKHYRQPKLYFKLPSQGRWWDQNSLDMPDNGELAVYSMTGKDELLMKNADALMNGAATTGMISSCVPSIKDAWSMPRSDLDTTLLAIRIATYGRDMDMESQCPSCNHRNDNTLDCSWVMEKIEVPSTSSEVYLDGMLLELRPVTYRDINQMDQDNYEERRIIMQLAKPELTDEQRVSIMQASVQKMAGRLGMRLAGNIASIMTPEGTKVTDRALIAEFINNCERDMFEKIRAAIEQYTDAYKLPKLKVECDSCKTSYETKLEFDPANFFAPGSSR